MTGRDGYTLVELSIGLLLSTLIAGITLTLYLTVVRYFHRWQDDLHAENTIHLILRQVTDDLYRTESVAKADAGVWQLFTRTGDTLTYRWEAARLFRNRRLVTDTTLTVLRFSIMAGFPASQAGAADEPPVPVSLVSVDVAVQAPNRLLKARTSVTLRGWFWAPLTDLPDGE